MFYEAVPGWVVLKKKKGRWNFTDTANEDAGNEIRAKSWDQVGKLIPLGKPSGMMMVLGILLYFF